MDKYVGRYDPAETARKFSRNHYAIRLIESEDSGWLTIASWPFPHECALKLSQLVNTFVIEVEVDHAYTGNWILRLGLSGYAVQTLLSLDYMRFLGLKSELYHIFSYPLKVWGQCLPNAESDALELLKNFTAGQLSNPNAAECVSDLLSRLGVWGPEWRRYFRPDDKCAELETYIVASGTNSVES
jgi:hypothetical protein